MSLSLSLSLRNFNFNQLTALKTNQQPLSSNLNRLKECIFRPVEYECGLGAEETLGRVIESLSGGLLAFSCRDYDPSGPKCAPFLSKPGARPKGSRSSSALSKIISSFTNVPARN